MTGGQTSTIDGVLKSTIGNANFYFINPSGVTFGANAKVDVPAAFHVSTADSLRFADGSEFSASNPVASQLSITEPISFGFVGTSNKSIAIQASQLAVKDGQSLDVVAGNITVQGNAKMSAPAGEIRLVATQGQAAVSLERNSANNLALPTSAPTLSNAGNINIQHSTLEAIGNGNEHVALWGGNTVVNSGQIHVIDESTANANPAKSLDIHSYALNLDHADIVTEAHNSGKGANINVQSTAGMNISNSSFIESRTMQEATAGDVNVEVGGNLNIYGLALRPAITTGILSRSLSGSSGNGGNVTVHAGNIALANGSAIFSRTQGLGNSGKVIVNSDNTITIDGRTDDPIVRERGSSVASIDANSRSGGSSISGNAGDVMVTAKEINIITNTYIGAIAYPNANNGGNVSVTANTIKIDGRNTEFNSAITSTAVDFSRGNAGNVTVNAGTIDINTAYISSDGYSTGKY